MGVVVTSWSKEVVIAALLLVAPCVILTGRSPAQTNYGNLGVNAVWNSSPIASPAFVDVDATGFAGDICTRINTIFFNMGAATTTGVVIDARGVTPTSGTTTQPCTTNPWYNATKNAPPATVLLPAGTITICATWTPPYFTKIIGEGPGQGGTLGTTLQVGSSSECGGQTFSGTAMIQMGGSACNSTDCFSVSVEDLTLDGQNASVDGIDNFIAQELSYVQHVAMVNIGGIGLSIGPIAGNSGPYSDLSIAVNSNA